MENKADEKIITIFDFPVRNELIQRINLLNETGQPVWGKMNVFQMSKHCTIWNDWILGNQYYVYKQVFLGKIFGKMALKSNTRNNKPIAKNMPAGKEFTVKENVSDLAALKSIWLKQIVAYGNFSNENFVHDFFGKMTKEQIGVFAYKHNDHHLRQFGV